MNILIQAYACSADKGGEFAVSYGWIQQLDQRLCEQDKIYVCSLTLKEYEIAQSGFKHVELLPIDHLEKFMKYSDKQYFYPLWQYLAYRTVKKRNIKLDVIHCYSLSDFRFPGYWSNIRNAYTILGPVGGGQRCPQALIGYDDRSHYLRDVVNWLCKVNPLYTRRMKKYDAKFVANYETKAYIRDANVLVDVPLDEKLQNLKVPVRKNQIPIILCMGRLINKKGFLFLIDVLEKLPRDISYRVMIYGEGPQKDIIQDRINHSNIRNKVQLKGYVNHEEVRNVYEKADIFVVPSLRESGGSVFIEAMACALPVVSLDMALSRILKENQCGLFVNTEQSKDELISEFANNIARLVDDKQLRIRLGQNGYRFVNTQMTWNNAVDCVYGELLKRE